MISTQFQHTLVKEGRALQQQLKTTLALRDSHHPRPDPDRFESKLRELVETPLNSLQDVHHFLLTWNDYQTKQANQAKRSRSLGEVMGSHQDARQAVWSNLYRVIEHANNACSSVETIAWHELAAFFAAQTLKSHKEDADIEFICKYAVSHTHSARKNILTLFKEYGVLSTAQIPQLATLAQQLNAQKAATSAEVTRLQMQINALPTAEPATTLEVAQLDLAGLDQIEAESVLAKRIKESLTATSIDWAQIKILLQSDCSNELLNHPVICGGKVLSEHELHAYRQLTQCQAPDKPDHYLRAFLQKKWVIALLQQSPDFMRCDLQKQMSKVQADAKANEDSVRFNAEQEELKWVEQLLGIQAFKTNMDELMPIKSVSRARSQQFFEQFLQPFREEQLYLDCLILANDRQFKNANAEQKWFALLLKDIARMAMLRLKVIATELIHKECYRLMHAAKITGLEDETIKWLEEMRLHPDDFGGLNLSSIQRDLNLEVGLFCDDAQVIAGINGDMKKYHARFKKDNANAYKERFSHLWLDALANWQKEIVGQIQTAHALCQNPQMLALDNFTGQIAAKARSIIPPDQEEVLQTITPTHRAPRWRGWLKTAALIAGGMVVAAGVAAAIVFSLGLAIPIVIIAVAGAGVLGGVGAFGVEKAIQLYNKRQKRVAVGAAKRAADEKPVSTSDANIHRALGTTTLLARSGGKVDHIPKPSAPTVPSTQRAVSNPSQQLNQNLRYSF